MPMSPTTISRGWLAQLASKLATRPRAGSPRYRPNQAVNRGLRVIRAWRQDSFRRPVGRAFDPRQHGIVRVDVSGALQEWPDGSRRLSVSSVMAQRSVQDQDLRDAVAGKWR